MSEKKKEAPAETNNLSVYEQARVVPATALKQIMSGRLKGKSDINPMFRIKRITEIFGPCGFGWRYEIVNQWLEPYVNQVKAFTQINLFIKMNGEWSAAIPGVGGADFVAQEKNGPYVNDECYKMSLTDALSVAMKALGIAADVYWDNDGKSLNPGDSKYRDTTVAQQPPTAQRPQQPAKSIFPPDNGEIEAAAIQDVKNCQSSLELIAVWNKYKSLYPEITKAGGKFYDAVATRGGELKKEGK